MDANVLFIVIDALRADVLSSYGHLKEVTPNIDMLAERGVLFENAFSCTNATDSSLTSILSGKYPQSHGILSHAGRVTEEEVENFYNSDTVFLSEVLSQEDYITCAVDWLGRWHRKGFHVYTRDYTLEQQTTRKKLRGFIRNKFPFISKLYAKTRTSLNVPRKLPYEDACEVTDVAAKLMKENSRKDFFLFVHYWDTHTPYNSPEEFTERFLGKIPCDVKIEEVWNRISKDSEYGKLLSRVIGNASSLDEVIARYYGSACFVDSQIGRLLDTLQSFGLLDKTLIVVTSDHGESLFRHGIYFDHHGLYDVSLHVPLVFYFPELLPGKTRINALVQHVGILPTILDAFDIRKDAYSFDGKSLLPLIYGEVENVRSSVYAEQSYMARKIAVRTEDFKYIKAPSVRAARCRYCNTVHGGVEELYDLNEDPEETNNLVEERPVVRRTMEDMIEEWSQTFQKHSERTRVKAKIRKLKKLQRI